MRNKLTFSLIIYSILLNAGGIFGYLQKGSLISLYASLIMGLIILLPIFLKNDKIAFYVSSWLTGGFITLFLVRYLLTGKMVPALFGLLSVALLWILQTQSKKIKNC